MTCLNKCKGNHIDKHVWIFVFNTLVLKYQDYTLIAKKMNSEELNLYKQQLQQVNQALLVSCDEVEKNELFALKNTIEELLSLSNDDGNEPSTSSDQMSDEFALFMDEMKKEGAVEKSTYENPNKMEIPKDIEGMKCRAPHQHQWGNVVYHNAMICSLVSDDAENDDDVKVRVLFTNPTHQEMLPCPYYYESDCKFSEEKCRFSHGEIVPYSCILEYIEPKFELLKMGSRVLAKQPSNLWSRAKIRRIYEDKYLVKFENDKKQVEINFEHVLPLDNEDEVSGDSSDSDMESDDDKEADRENIINQSLLITPSEQALGNWEKYTRGVGSKLMTKMGYIIGTGLGKNADGRIDPISAVVLPQGKSLDHCMKLREQAGGDKNLFSVEKKLQRLQRKQEKQNQKNYEKGSANKHNVFNLINKSLEGTNEENVDKSTERRKIKQECSRNLNIKSLQVADNIRRAERDLEKLNDSLSRHTDVSSNVHLKLKDKVVYVQDQLKMYQTQAQMIKNEQSLRNDKKKMTVF